MPGASPAAARTAGERGSRVEVLALRGGLALLAGGLLVVASELAAASVAICSLAGMTLPCSPHLPPLTATQGRRASQRSWSTWREALAIVGARGNLRSTIAVALIVGTLLCVINQFDLLLHGHVDPSIVLKMVLTYAVPFCVSNYGLLTATKRRRRVCPPGSSRGQENDFAHDLDHSVPAEGGCPDAPTRSLEPRAPTVDQPRSGGQDPPTSRPS